MKFHFLDWIDRKQPEDQNWSDDGSVDFLSEPELAYQTGDYWVITNSGKFLKDIIKMPKKGTNEKPELQRTHPLKYSLFHIDGIDGQTVHMNRPEDKYASIRDEKRSYSGGAERRSEISNLVDVTDSFRMLGIGKAGDNNRYFIDKSKSTMNRMRPQEFQRRLEIFISLTKGKNAYNPIPQTSDERSLIRNLKKLNDLIQSGVLNTNANALTTPEVVSILNHPNAQVTAQKFGLNAILQYMQAPMQTATIPNQTSNPIVPVAQENRTWRSETRSVYLTEGKKFFSYYPER